MTGGTFDAEGGKTVMSVSGNSHLRFENITFTGGGGSNDGGGLYISGNSDVKLYNGARIIRNEVTGGKNGGGIYIESGSLTIDGAEFTKNESNGSGGGLYAGGGANITIKSGLFIVNRAARGGAIYAKSTASFTMTGCNITANTATSDGGGIYVIGSSSAPTAINMTGVLVSGNVANSQGGGIIIDRYAVAIINGGAIQKNDASYRGGGIFIADGEAQIGGGCIIKENVAVQGGGGIHCLEGKLTVDGAEIRANKSTGTDDDRGGGIHLNSSNVVFTLRNAIIDSNESACDGGGIMSNCNWTLENSVKITNNKATRNGGGVYVFSRTMTYTTGAVISGNTANGGTPGKGHSIYNNTGTVTGGITMSAGNCEDGDLPLP